jgi:hypothetical protein
MAAGRGVDNEVIHRTEDKQLPTLMVHSRCDETFGTPAVAGVTESIRASANARGPFGLARINARDHLGKLVPLTAGVASKANPTISHVPLVG